VSQETIDGFRQMLNTSVNDYTIALKNLENIEADLQKKEKLLNDYKKKTSDVGEKVREQKQKKEEWLRQKNVKDRDEYVGRVNVYRESYKTLKDWEKKLSEYLAGNNCSSAVELKTLCAQKMIIFDEQNIPAAGKPEDERRKNKRLLEEYKAKCDALRNELSALQKKAGEESGFLKGSLGPIPDMIVEKEKEAGKIKDAIRQLELEREGALLALEVFTGLSADIGRMFNELALEVKNQYSLIFPEARNMSMASLNTETVTMSDAGGMERPVDLLSSGTRDSFLFAARLALAKKACEKDGILVLDEPFLSLDCDRQKRALAMLRRFQEETNYQIILLTKDEELVREIKKVFPAELVRENVL